MEPHEKEVAEGHKDFQTLQKKAIGARIGERTTLFSNRMLKAKTKVNKFSESNLTGRTGREDEMYT